MPCGEFLMSMYFIVCSDILSWEAYLKYGMVLGLATCGAHFEWKQMNQPTKCQ